MEIKNLIFKILLLFAICYLLFAIGNANAQELSVSLDPPILQIEASPPSLIKNPISIINQADQSVTYSIFLLPFKAKSSNNGEIEFDSSQISEYKNIFDNVKISDENKSITQITLAPKQKKDLILSIRIPENEPARDYYFSVIFISEAGKVRDQNSLVGTRGGIGTNVLLSIGPKSPTQGRIEEFSAPIFVTRGPVRFRLNVVNQSKHYISPEGNILIKNIFGQTVGNINLPSTNILENSGRFIGSEDNLSSTEPRLVWNEKFLLGIYKADLTLALSSDGPIINKSIRFFAFPLEAALGIVLTLVLLIGMVKRAKSKSS